MTSPTGSSAPSFSAPSLSAPSFSAPSFSGPSLSARSFSAEAVIAMLGRTPRVLALGEPTHGEDILLEARNDLFRQLIEQYGYRTIAIESDCLRGLLVNDFVTSGQGTLEDVMQHGFSHDFGKSVANRELVLWMRSFNVDRPEADQIRFAGFDGPLEISGAESPRAALMALHSFLVARLHTDLLPCTGEVLEQLLGNDDRWTNPAAMRDPSQSIGQYTEAARLRLLADNLVVLMESQAPQLIESAPLIQWDRARLFARTAVGLLRYHFWMADTSPHRLNWLLGIRDSMMAANLIALAERSPVLVHAHNGHLQRDKSSMRMGDAPLEWWSAGAIVSAHLGADYGFVTTALGTIRHRGVDEPSPDSIEGFLYALPAERILVDPTELSAASTPRVSSWYGYAPFDPAHLPGIDGLLFVRDCPVPA